MRDLSVSFGRRACKNAEIRTPRRNFPAKMNVYLATIALSDTNWLDRGFSGLCFPTLGKYPCVFTQPRRQEEVNPTIDTPSPWVPANNRQPRIAARRSNLGIVKTTSIGQRSPKKETPPGPEGLDRVEDLMPSNATTPALHAVQPTSARAAVLAAHRPG